MQYIKLSMRVMHGVIRVMLFGVCTSTRTDVDRTRIKHLLPLSHKLTICGCHAA